MWAGYLLDRHIWFDWIYYEFILILVAEFDILPKPSNPYSPSNEREGKMDTINGTCGSAEEDAAIVVDVIGWTHVFIHQQVAVEEVEAFVITSVPVEGETVGLSQTSIPAVIQCVGTCVLLTHEVHGPLENLEVIAAF